MVFKVVEKSGMIHKFKGWWAVQAAHKHHVIVINGTEGVFITETMVLSVEFWVCRLKGALGCYVETFSTQLDSNHGSNLYLIHSLCAGPLLTYHAVKFAKHEGEIYICPLPWPLDWSCALAIICHYVIQDGTFDPRSPWMENINRYITTSHVLKIPLLIHS